MSWEDTEKSIEDNSPIELYKFSRPNVGKIYLYTSSPDPITLEGLTYEPVALEREAVKVTEDVNKASLDIKLPYTVELVLDYVGEVIVDAITVTVYRENVGGFIQYWAGSLDSISVSEPFAEASCVTVAKAMEDSMLHLLHSVQCPYQLFHGATCRVDENLFTVAGTVSASTGTTIQSVAFATKPDGWFLGGQITINARRRMIMGHTGDVITISPYLLTGAGDTFQASAGCAHTTTDCTTKFGNLLNYGGEPYIPVKDPWQTRIT